MTTKTRANEAPANERYSNLDPIGRCALEAVRKRLMIDPEWTVEHGDGFSWWSHRLRQTFRVTGPIDLEGLPTRWLSFETDVAAGLDGPDDRKTLVATTANRVSNLYTTVVDGDRLRHRARVYFMPETLPHRTNLLADRALLSNTDAHMIADTFVERAPSFGLDLDRLRVDESAHPSSGRRPEPDEMLSVRDTVLVPMGDADPPPDRTVDLDAAADFLASVTRADMSVRVTDRHVESIGARLVARHAFGAYQLMNGIRHPILGFGTLSLLRVVPKNLANEEEARRVCQRLDAAEWHGWTPLLSIGAWVPDRFGDPHDLAYAYATFHPNACVVPGLSTELASDALRRFMWTAPHVTSRSGDAN